MMADGALYCFFLCLFVGPGLLPPFASSTEKNEKLFSPAPLTHSLTHSLILAKVERRGASGAPLMTAAQGSSKLSTLHLLTYSLTHSLEHSIFRVSVVYYSTPIVCVCVCV